MWETIFVVAAFVTGWRVRKTLEQRNKAQQTEKPEMMWFNNKKSQWERVTSLQLRVDERAVVSIPVKLIEG